MKKVFSATLDGFEAKIVENEVSFIKALPGFLVVGLANNSIQESKERVKSALIHNDFYFPPKKITVNLSPSDLHKSGSHFDLSIALLIAMQDTDINFEDFFVFGELGLDGKVKDTFSIFPIILSLTKQKINKKIIVPKDSIEKLKYIPNIEVYPVNNLEETINFFKKKLIINPIKQENLNFKSIVINNTKFFYEESFNLDFKDVKGQENAKRAALIASAGMHNLILEGSPGCGKSMIIKRLRAILAPLSLNEILQISKNEALDKELFKLSALRPFRACHHSSTKSSILGGGTSTSKAGEIALAHLGILFFDELPHFSKNILEALREPLEDKHILISRVHTKVKYNTNFMFCAALNPCPCANLFSKKSKCRCSEIEIQRYKNKISEALLDRIDIYVKMQEINSNDKASYSSKQMQSLVIKAFIMQKKRGQEHLNSNLNDNEIQKYCILDKEGEEIMNKAINNFNLSNRSIKKIKSIARTIADLEEKENIKKEHIIEALGYRRR